MALAEVSAEGWAEFWAAVSLPPQPATKATSNNTRNHIFENPLHLFMVSPSLGTFEIVRLI
jgi:hypothetical protein